MKTSTIRNKLIGLIIIFLTWLILNCFYPPIVIPKPNQVLIFLYGIFSEPSLRIEIFRTISRLLIGLFSGVSVSILITIIFVNYRLIEDMFFPIINFIQVVPPVTWLIMALIWFGFGGIPVIFIIFVSVIPIITISLVLAIKSLDESYIKVSRVFQLTNSETWKYVKIPALLDSFNASFMIAIGSSTKLAAMAELLTTETGIGGQIALARINIATEGVVAWSLILIMIYYLIEGVFKCLIKRGDFLRNFWYRQILAKNFKTKKF